jgi:hypothetical protein
MAARPLEILKRGLAKFSKTIKDHKENLNAEINGGDNIDRNAIRLRSTRQEVLQAMSTIGLYIEDLNDPIACKIEANLGSFNMQVRLDEVNPMKPTFLIDYYKRV